VASPNSLPNLSSVIVRLPKLVLPDNPQETHIALIATAPAHRSDHRPVTAAWFSTVILAAYKDEPRELER